MKKLLLLISLSAITVMAKGQTNSVKIGALSIKNTIVYKTLKLKRGDRFWFGYTNRVNLYRIVDFNETGVFACFNFEGIDADNATWFSFHDIYGSKYFKLLIK